MIKKLNIISFLLLVVTSFLVLFTYQADMDVHIPYIDTIFVVLAVLFSILLILKVVLRWQALSISFKNDGYKISSLGFKNTIVYELINIVFYLLVGLTIVLYIPEIRYLGIVLFLFFVEGVAHLVINKLYEPYKIIINPNTIVVITNNIKILNWKNIIKIEEKHNDLLFKDKNKLIQIIDFDLLSKNDATKAKEEIKNISLKKGLYYGKS